VLGMIDFVMVVGLLVAAALLIIISWDKDDE
jgi:hypothetical protein